MRVLFAECTNADAGYDAERLVDAFPGLIEAEGALLDDLPDRLERFHYDLVATTTFHADEAQVLVAGRIPVVAMLVGPGYLELVHEIAGLPNGSRVGPRVRLGARIRQHPRDAGPGRDPRRRHRVGAHRRHRGPRAGRPDGRHHPALARGAGRGPGSRPSRAASGSGRGPTTSIRPAWSCCAGRSSTSRAHAPGGGDAGLTLAGARAGGILVRRHVPTPYDGLVRRDFHVRREPRDRYAVGGSLIGTRGDLVVADTAGIRRLAARMNADRAGGAPSVQAGEIGALGLLHEIGHLLVARYEASRRPGAMSAALAALDARLGPDSHRLLDRFGQEFPGPGPEPEPPTERLEELMLTRISNENPALGPLRELVDDRELAQRHPLRGGHRRTGGGLRRRASGRRPGHLAHRADADAGPRRPHVAGRRSCATSASTGGRSSGPGSTT